MAVTAADIQAMPGLSGVSTADATFWLDMAGHFVSDDVFATDGGIHDRATKLWVAHACTLQLRVGMDTAGALKGKRVGDVQASYATGPGGDIGSTSWLASTQWGRLYMQMAHTQGCGSYPVV